VSIQTGTNSITKVRFMRQFVALVDVSPLDGEFGRRVGVLLSNTRTADVIDAAVALLAVDGDSVPTSDLASLVAAAGVHADVIRV
jgi:hypothetical protein